MIKQELNKCLKSIFKLKRLGIKLETSTIKNILKDLDDPQNNFQSIHIAGTNGKGSVAAILSTILQKAGYKVGLYTSPHLLKFNERIKINNIPISNKSILDFWQKSKFIKLNRNNITFFEFTTAMAFHEFNSKKIDFAVIETGMGGRLDATNIIKPILCIITNISLDHKEYLGNTISQISNEKAGIIKPNIPVVSGIKQKNAIKVIKSKTKITNSELLLIKKNFKTRKNKYGNFTYFGKYNKWEQLRTNLLGKHQIENSAIALAACEILNSKYTYLSINNIRRGLLETKWEGRLEIVSKNPHIILDGAHNLIAIKNLTNYIKENIHKNNLTIIVGILNDKSYKNMLKHLAVCCSELILTQAKNERSVPVKILEKKVKKFKNNITLISNVAKALFHAINNKKKNKTICVTGSLYVVGEAKKELLKLIKNKTIQ